MGKQLLIWALFVALLIYSWLASHGSLELAKTETSALRFVESAVESGMDFRHQPPQLDPRIASILPQVAGTGAAVSVVDVNGDGWMDVYAVSSREGDSNALFINRGDGTFEDHASQAGLAQINTASQGVSHGSLWADFDRDGDQDVLVYMWGKSRLFRNESDSSGLRFEEVDKGGFPDRMYASAACLLDLDRDGDLDLFLGGYYRAETNLWDLDSMRFLHDDQEFARNGGRNHVLRNDGDMRFVDISESHLVPTSRWTYAAASADLDGDGWQDLYIANDYGTEEFLRNAEGKGFESVQGLGLGAKSKSGMCVAFGDVTNSGQLAVFVTNISEPGYLMQGNNMRLISNGDAGGLRMDNVLSLIHI